MPFNPSLLAVLGGLLCHAFFKRVEPHRPGLHFAIIFAIPVGVPLLMTTTPEVMLGLGEVLQFVAVYISTLVLSVCAYRLAPFHPLAQYPGPVLCKLSKLWMMYTCWQGKQHIYYQNLHKRYGDVVRIGPNELSICDPAVLAPLLSQNELPKGPMWDGRAGGSKHRSLVGVRDPSEHARRRRPWARAMSTAALKDYEPIIKKRANELIECLEKMSGPVDLAAYISYFAYDFMSDMGFGGGLDMLRNGDQRGLWHLLDSSVPTPTILGHVPWLGEYYTLMPGMKATMPQFRAFAIQCAKKRVSEGSTTKDIFYYLNNEDGSETVQPPLIEVISGATLVIVAGSDTTATALSNVFYLLLSHPAAYRRLQDEINEHFAPGDEVMDASTHLHMPYLNGVINESLRMFPPIPSGGQRANPPDAPTKILGPYAIPGGTGVIAPTYVLHRDSRNFSEPDRFLPERWLPPDLQVKLEAELFSKERLCDFKHDTAAFVPFSLGSANCIGKTLAYIEMRMVVCLLMRRFEMRLLSSPETWVESLEDFFVMRKGSLMVEISPRNWE